MNRIRGVLVAAFFCTAAGLFPAFAQFDLRQGLLPEFPPAEPRFAEMAGPDLDAAADSGVPGACLEAARRAAGKKPSGETLDVVRRRLRRAGEGGSDDAWCLLGLLMMNQFVPEDRQSATSPAQAAECWKAAAEHGHPRSMHLLGMLSVRHAAGTMEEGEAWLTRAAGAEYVPSMRQLGGLRAYPTRMGAGARPADQAAARDWFRKGADKGDPASMFALGCLLIHGVEAVRDSAQGRLWLGRSAAKGHAWAAQLLAHPLSDSPEFSADPLLVLVQAGVSAPPGIALNLRRGTVDDLGWVDLYLLPDRYPPRDRFPKEEPSFAAARRGPGRKPEEELGDEIAALESRLSKEETDQWAGEVARLRKGERVTASLVIARLRRNEDTAMIRDPVVCRQTAELLWDGVPDLPASPEKAVRWFTRAAQAGDTASMVRLARLWTGDWAEKPDPKAAAEWFLEAAQRGDAEAQVEMARSYRDGVGVEPDAVRALAWMRVAGGAMPASEVEALQAKAGASAMAEAEKKAATYRRTIAERKPARE
jgi:TPR repeat protein